MEHKLYPLRNALPLQIKIYLNKGGMILFIPNSISWLANHLDWKENSVYVCMYMQIGM
jgi:hypothetical protein